MSYESFLNLSRWKDATRSLLVWCYEKGFKREEIERHLLFRFWRNMPGFQNDILQPGNRVGSFEATLDGNVLCHIVYRPAREYKTFTSDVTVTWYKGTDHERVETWSLIFLRNKDQSALIRNKLKCISSLTFESNITVGQLKASGHNLQNMRNLLEFM